MSGQGVKRESTVRRQLHTTTLSLLSKVYKHFLYFINERHHLVSKLRSRKETRYTHRQTKKTIEINMLYTLKHKKSKVFKTKKVKNHVSRGPYIHNFTITVYWS